MSGHALVVRGEVVHRVFVPDNLLFYQRWLDKHEGQRVEFTLEREQRIRSNPQLAYYWGVLIWECCQQLGLQPTESNKQDFHHHFLEHVAKPMLIDRMSRYVRKGVKLDRGPSTGEFTVEEMTEYIERCKDLAAMPPWNVHVPSIDQVKIKGPR